MELVMKIVDQMSLIQLRELAMETDSLQILWRIFKNCKNDVPTLQKIIENPIVRFDQELVRCVQNCGDDRIKRYMSDMGIGEKPVGGVKYKFPSKYYQKTPVEKINSMSLEQLRAFATKVNTLEEAWRIFENCNGDAHTIQKLIENDITHTDPQMIRWCFECGDKRVKSTLARHTTDEEIIRKAADPNVSEVGVRCAVALNENIPLPVLIALTHDSDWSVRISTLSNPLIVQELLKRMASDSNIAVSKMAISLLQQLEVR